MFPKCVCIPGRLPFNQSSHSHRSEVPRPPLVRAAKPPTTTASPASQQRPSRSCSEPDAVQPARARLQPAGAAARVPPGAAGAAQHAAAGPGGDPALQPAGLCRPSALHPPAAAVPAGAGTALPVPAHAAQHAGTGPGIREPKPVGVAAPRGWPCNALLLCPESGRCCPRCRARVSLRVPGRQRPLPAAISARRGAGPWCRWKRSSVLGMCTGPG